MFYEYECNDCGRVTELQLSPKGDIPQTIDCYCGNFAYRIWGGYQINMNKRVSAMREYDRLPEHIKTGDTSFLK